MAMSTNGLVVLDLRTPAGRAKDETQTEAAECRRLLGEAFAMLAEVLGTGIPTPADLTASLNKCREGIASGAETAVLSPLAADCFTLMGRFAVLARNHETEHRNQVAALVTMVQDAVTAIAGSQANLDETLNGSVDRFERLARLDNVEQIQAQLFKEVKTLKRLAIERRATWEETFQEFGQRLNGLETQLDSTRREAAVDPLTNIANRRTFERTCLQWTAVSRPRFVIGMIDVDDFKTINDGHGHPVGDQVLVTVAETLARSFRTDDVVARLGGDEFAVLAAALTLEQAHSRFSAIVKAVELACKQVLPERATSVSTGLAESRTGDTPATLQQRADAALYEAKRQGKGRVVAKQSPFMLKGGGAPATAK
jgi:diguanylate cyclase (GGDEF)-like protein